jgi:hypothetical protein
MVFRLLAPSVKRDPYCEAVPLSDVDAQVVVATRGSVTAALPDPTKLAEVLPLTSSTTKVVYVEVVVAPVVAFVTAQDSVIPDGTVAK